jgi:predicted DNA-binding transcriptional regulator YafY
MGNRKLCDDSRTERALAFVFDLLRARKPIPYDYFKDPAQWGSWRSMERLFVDINTIWEKHRGLPLFEIFIDDNKRFLRLVDTGFEDQATRRVSVITAMMEFLRILKGTLLEDELGLVKNRVIAGMSVAEKKRFERLEQKFFFVGKGVKDYSHAPVKEVLEDVYTALFLDCALEVDMERERDTVKRLLYPRSLILFNNGLYLIAHFEEQTPNTRPYTFKIESFTKTTLHKKHKCPPAIFDPSEHFRDSFGITQSKPDAELQDIVLEFDDTPSIQRYIRERRWSDNDTFEDLPEGQLRLTMRLRHTTEVIPFVLSWGHHVRVVAPKAMRAEITNIARKMSSLYG